MNHRSLRRLFRSVVAGISLVPSIALAAVFDGGGIMTGLGAAGGIQGLTHRPLREVIITIVIRVLDYLSLAAVVVIVTAGIWLVLGFGEESAREKAQRMIIYTIIGLTVAFLARLIVSFILVVLQGNT